jgi:putative hemolysin
MTKEILVPRTEVVGFPCDATLEEVLRTIAEKKFSRYPVYDNDLDSIIGIVTVKDILRFLADPNKKPFNLRELVSSKVLIVPETKKIGELLREFQAQRVQMAVAVDEFGGTAGIVTTEDVVEEIVGEIYDEYEKAEELAKPIGDGVYLVQGRAPIEVLQEIFGVELPEQDNYETIGGLVMTHAGRVPQVGEAIEYFGLRFEIKERTRTRVLSLLVSKVREVHDG